MNIHRVTNTQKKNNYKCDNKYEKRKKSEYFSKLFFLVSKFSKFLKK